MKKILLAEDNDGQAKAIHCSLAAAGFEVRTAHNGYEAWEFTLVEQFALVITDYNMPKLTGADLCRRLRQDEGYANVPIVLMTACADDLDLARLSSNLSITEIWSKPLSLSSVVGRVKAILTAEGKLLEVLGTPDADPFCS